MKTAEADGGGNGIDRKVADALTGLEPDREQTLQAFATAYLRRIPSRDLERLDNVAIVGRVHSAFRLLDRRGFDPATVRVFDPTIEENGYETRGTVVEIVIDDQPFLVDSVTNAVTTHGFHVARTLHPVIGTERDEDGRIIRVEHGRDAAARESVEHYELEERLSAQEAAALATVVAGVLRDVSRAVDDFEAMKQAVAGMADIAGEGRSRYSEEEIEEGVAFVDWLLDLNFVFLGYREYQIDDDGQGPCISVVPGAGLGIFSEDAESAYAEPVRMASLSPDLDQRWREGELVVVTKTNRHSTVHRNARMDYIGVRRVGADGSVTGEARLVGLFTSKAYMSEAAAIPILRRKLDQILESEDLIEGSHDFKLFIQLFESFPKDDLFAMPVDEVRQSLVGLVELEEQEHVRLFVRRDTLRRNVSLLVVLPRDAFNSELRKRLQELFLEKYQGNSVDYRLSLGESGDARIHFTVWVDQQIPNVPLREIEAEVLALAKPWANRVHTVLVERVGEDEADRLIAASVDRFPDYYRSSMALPLVAGDIIALDELIASGKRVMVGLQNEPGPGEQLSRIAVYRLDGKLDLSAMLPLIEHLGVRVVEEVPTRLEGGDGETFIHDFGVVGPNGGMLDLDECGLRVCSALSEALAGTAETDSLNRLLITAGLDHHQIEILRAYRTYWRLVTASFSIRYIDDAFARNPEVAHNLVKLFEARFGRDGDEGTEAALRADILHDLESIESLDEDRILRGFLGLIEATVRTNAYLPDRGALSLKLRSARVPEMPEPRPVFEIFVYGSAVEGIHLRGGRTARGGIRWSTRREDYRTEVLGLMKAQMTKNAIIVPSGAKGGFVLREGATTPERIRSGYEAFIRGLLDVTDNLSKGDIEHPPGVRVHDGPDPYLVVAADRGTAALSDVANDIAADYGFWLGDAFASGGSTGYDHKALGITARGAWESVRRHFVELGADVDEAPLTVVGIGDMSGDVFGNGMLMSRKLRLIAAFDHRHVFIDPNPDPNRSYEERVRLAADPDSTWEDYDRDSLSVGGGVWPRAAKRIDLSMEARTALGVEQAVLTPAETIRAILRAPVDLLWNGGIGTYVKAATESHEAVKDRANDGVRVDGRDVRAKVIGEGGNLGLTQSGRVEVEHAGGRLFTDFIDNSGGVDTSDREVNLKVLLGLAIERGDIDEAERNQIVASVADDVVAAVVYDNFLQAQIVSQEASESQHRMDEYEDLMVGLEEERLLDRSLEELPDSERMAERARDGLGLTRPEISVLLAYAKRSLTDDLLGSSVPDAAHFEVDLREYFPPRIVERFGHLITDHPLRRELVATIVANQVLNSEGSTFVIRLQAETGSTADEVVEAYRIARAVTGAAQRWRAVEGLSGSVEPGIQRLLMQGVDDLVETVARWYLVRPNRSSIEEEVALGRVAFEELAAEISTVGPDDWRIQREAAAETLILAGVEDDLARRHAYQAELAHGPDIAEVARGLDRPVLDVAKVFFRVGQAFRIDWLEQQVEALPSVTRWQRWAVQALHDELLLLRRELAEAMLEEAGEDRSADAAADAYLLTHAQGEGRLIRMMRLLARDGVADAASAIVAIRQIRALVG